MECQRLITAINQVMIKTTVTRSSFAYASKSSLQTIDCDLVENEKIAIPIVMRLSLFLIVPLLHWSFHRFVHHGIMQAEKLARFERIMKQYKWLPDILMILALVGLHFILE